MAGRGKLPLKEYRRQQRVAAQQQASEATATGAAADGEAAAAAAEPSDGSHAAVAGGVRLELEAFVEKSKVQFLLRGAAGSENAPDASQVLPCVLHPARARWAEAGAEWSEWCACALEPSGSGSDWTEVSSHAIRRCCFLLLGQSSSGMHLHLGPF